ncbi:MAG: hypothetical protein KDA20_00165 [Phycisphaerales bacterium]|nr:hypothetical protein [Phycisphaerales bacterium]
MTLTQPPAQPNRRGSRAGLALVLVLAAALSSMAGCWVPALIGGMAQSAHDTGSSLKYAEYEDLAGHNYAVVIQTTRGIAGEYPQLVGVLTNAVSKRMIGANDKIQATGVVPGPRVLEFQYATPRWEAWTYGKVAEHLGVTRLIIVDVHEFRLYEPGNRYVWNGRAGVRVGVVEAEDPGAVDFSFTKDFYIPFPDDVGYTQNDMSTAVVIANLQERVANRVAWLFFDHDEPNRIEY